MKIHTELEGIEYWYDPHVRIWYAMQVDENGNQMGDTIDAAHKQTLLDLIARGFLATNLEKP